jgi:hypothetical protein
MVHHPELGLAKGNNLAFEISVVRHLTPPEGAIGL